jgi:DNA repair protein RecO (recombination protein O)
MLSKTTGVVLRTVKYSETSVITSVFTKHFGLLSFIVPGVRSNKSKNKAALFHPMNILALEIYMKPDKNLLRLKEFAAAIIYKEIPFHILKSAVGLFYVEVLNQVIREHEENDVMFDFIIKKMLALDQLELNAMAPIFFLIELSSLLGFAPQNNFSLNDCFFDLTGGTFSAVANPSSVLMNKDISKKLNEVLTGFGADSFSKNLRHEERMELFQTMIQYYSLHIENFKPLNTVKVLRSILYE